MNPLPTLPPPASPLKRVPLQVLPLSPSGGLARARERITRPTPSIDKENIRAVVQALQHRQATIVHRTQLIAEQFRIYGDRLATRSRHLDHLLAIANSHIAAQPTNHPRLSMPLVDSDDSGSEPDLSVLGMARPGPTAAAAQAIEQQTPSMSYHEGEDEENQDQDQDGGEDDDDALSQEQYEAEDTSIEEDQADEEEEEDEGIPLIGPATAGLKEISNLARFTVSSHKPGNGVEELRSDDLKMFWQSDGPQPHKLTVYFVKRVGIRDIRFFVDYNEDESYTPTKIIFKSGTSENNLIEFATIALESPVGWQQVPLAGAGGDPDGNTLVSYVLQMEILENHQNGKDTHLRGIKIYAFDADSAQGPGRDVNPVEDVVGLVDEAVARNVRGGPGHRLSSVKRQPGLFRFDPGEGGLTIPDFMREPELR